jgi:ADP-ribosyl-[dinitrogen reductase] hydrolase
MDKNRVLGALIGKHVGDSLGATLEFGPASKEWNSHTEIIGGGHFKWNPGAATDDTDLMIALLKSMEYIDGGYSLNYESMVSNYVEWLDKQPPDVGMTTLMGISNLEELHEFSDENIRSCGGTSENSQSNGSLMRCAPMALTMPEKYRQIVTQTMSTHAHPLCVKTDLAFIQVLRRVLWNSASKDEIIEGCIREYDSFPEAHAYLTNYMDFTWDQLKTSGYVLDTIGSALWAFKHTDNFEDGLLNIVNRGDDSDTCGAVTGALLGAYYGYDAIPHRWKTVIEYHDTIVDIVNDLLDVKQ